jgi:GT2 family glycosyltransferase/4-amino-4-deoxy-L-arabinose transferase-like glycosyltransferase
MHLKTQPAQTASPSSTSHFAPKSRWEHVAHSPLWMVLIAFTARVLYIALAHSYRFRTTDANFSFGWEIGRIAYSIANGHGFSSPFGGDTGPSAWNAPIYPWIVSVAFRVFGSYTHAAAFALLVFNSIFAALTCWPIYRIARRVFNETVAVWSGWIWALLPYVIYWSVRWVWETSLSAFLMTLLLMLTVEMEGDGRLSSWFGYGLLWGVEALTNPSALSFLPFAGCWLAYQLYRRGKGFIVPALLSAVVFWMTMMPWLVRNYEVFHKPVFVRDNVGVEIRCGNNPVAEGVWVAMYHPSQNPLMYEKYKRLGEADFSADEGRLARQWIKENPRKFAVITFRKVIFFWNGLPRLTKYPQLEQFKNSLYLATSVLAIWGLLLALKRRVHGVFLFASLMIVYPLVYYVSFTHPRYRHPIDPELLILGVYLVSEARSRTRTPNLAEEADRLESEILPQFHTLSVIIPVYNEHRTVMKLLQQVARQPLSLHKELIIVDDCSTDGTREVLQQTDLQKLLGGNGANTIKLVLHEKNQGKGAGVRTALEHVSGELVLIQDADLEYDPRDYPRLIAPILEGHADAVFGNRFHSGAHRIPRYYRYLLNRAFSLVCNALTGLAIHDVTACYKVFRREIFSRMTIRSDRFSIETEITVKLAKLGVRIYEVPIVYHGRTYAEGKKISWTDGVAAFYHLIRYRLKD